MWRSTVDSIARVAETTAVELAWTQWGAISSTPVSGRTTRANGVVDPEALILLSLVVADHERRLLDIVAARAREVSQFVSVQRMRTVARWGAPAAVTAVSTFAAMAYAGGDARWRKLAETAMVNGSSPRVKQLGALRLGLPAALMWRLRAGFGVGIKSDLLTILLASDAMYTVSGLATEAGYTTRGVRDALDELVAAQLVQRVHGPVTGFRLVPEGWPVVLGYDLPDWRPWASLTMFLTHVMAWTAVARQENMTPYVASSRARDLIENHLGPALRTALPPRPGASEPGEAYLGEFAEVVRSVNSLVREWL